MLALVFVVCGYFRSLRLLGGFSGIFGFVVGLPSRSVSVVSHGDECHFKRKDFVWR